jgi:hypothetical protein
VADPYCCGDNGDWGGVNGAARMSSDDAVLMLHTPPRSALVLCDSDDEALISRPMHSCPPPLPVPFFALTLPRRLGAMAEALLG